MNNCNSVGTPTEIGVKLIKNPKGTKVDSTHYKQIGESLMYLTTRPDTMYVVVLLVDI